MEKKYTEEELKAMYEMALTDVARLKLEVKETRDLLEMALAANDKAQEVIDNQQEELQAKLQDYSEMVKTAGTFQERYMEAEKALSNSQEEVLRLKEYLKSAHCGTDPENTGDFHSPSCCWSLYEGTDSSDCKE